MKLIIITEHLDQVCADWLAERAEVVWCKHEEGAKLDELLPRAEALVVRTYTQVNAALLAKAPKLKVVGRAGVGLDNVDLSACKDRGVKVVYTPDANTQAVVEYVTALLLDAYRPREAMPSPCDEKTFHAMRKTLVGTQLDQLTLGILGFGRIGKRIGQVAHAIGMKVVACDLLPEAELRKAVRFPFEFATPAELYARADVLTVHVDGRAGNRNYIDGAALAQFKPSCLLINTSRGFVIHAAALQQWATGVADKGGRAVLDVHEPEPPAKDYVLWGLPNVRLLPHLASRTGPAMENMSWVVRDVAAVLAGEEPRYPA
ncbi:MAG: NAD(P)-dependent oxidoreductase [Phycisphaeraceae bacterium]